MLRLTTHFLIIVALLGHAVVDATLAFTSPLGVEWKVGSQYLITWMDNGDGKPMPATFDLSLLSGQSSALQLIANVASNVNSASGVYQWTIPNDINPGKYVLRAGGGDGTYSPYFDIIGADPNIPAVVPTASTNATTSNSPVASQNSTNTSTSTSASQNIRTSDSKSATATSSVGAIVGTSETPSSIITSSVITSSTVEPSSSSETLSSSISSTTVVTPITSSNIPSSTTSDSYKTPTPPVTSSGSVKHAPIIVMLMGMVMVMMGMSTLMGSYGGVF